MKYAECLSRGIRPIITIGASAGGLKPMISLLKNLDKDLPAAIFIVQHLYDSNSALDEILNQSSVFPVRFVEDTSHITLGNVYVAPPDFHLLLEDGQMRLFHGPRENWTRPAIDPLFRSAAIAYKSCVTGVILSGMLDDGSAGLAAIKQCRGCAIVQDPHEAEFTSMPRSALQQTKPDYCIPVSEMPEAFRKMVYIRPEEDVMVPRELLTEMKMFLQPTDIGNVTLPGTPSPFACPDCGGPLFEFSGNGPTRYRCYEGHGYTAKILSERQEEHNEDSLWQSARNLDQLAKLRRKLSKESLEKGHTQTAEILERRAMESETQAQNIRNLLTEMHRLRTGDDTESPKNP